MNRIEDNNPNHIVPLKLANTLTEAANRSGLSVPYLRKRMGKELKVTRFGRAIRILESDLVAFLRNGVDEKGAKD